MKSIRGKAEEHAPYTKEDSWNWIKTAINAQTSFEAGANYVLDAINDVLSHPRRFANDDISISEAMIVEITKIVEQLK